MKKFKTAILLLLCAVLAAGAAACASEDGGGTVTTADNNTGDSPGDSEDAEEEVKLLPDLPDDLDFGGYQFKIMYRSMEENIVLGVRDIYADEETGEAINDAVYIRNKNLEAKYNFEIVGIPSAGDMSSSGAIRRLVQAGDAAYDVAITRMQEVATLMTTASLVDFNDVPGIDLDKPWWDKSLTEQMSVAGKNFSVLGDIISTNSNALRVIFFNKDMLANLALESPYKMVKENAWNLDNFYNLCKDVSQDLNGDGVMGIEDRYGYLVQGGITSNMFYAAGQNFISKDAQGMPQPAVLGEKAMLVLEKINTILLAQDAVMFDQDYEGVDPRGIEYVLKTTFEEERGLFFAEILQLAERMRSTETVFGILPPPKADSAQADYMSFADAWCLNLLVVPATNDNLEMTGQILEAMAAESKYTLLPAYYEKTLQGKYARDDDSLEMLEIIIANKVISLDEAFGWGMHAAIQDVLYRRTGDFVSAVERTADRQTSNIERSMSRILE